MIRKLFDMTIILLFAAAFVFAQEKNTKMNKDETEIRANIEQMVKGWNMKSGAEFAKPFAEDSDYVVVNGTHVKSRAAVAAGHQQIFDTIYKDSRNNGIIKQIRFVRPAVAIVHVEWNLSFKVHGEEKKGNALSTILMIKEKDKWSIAAFQNTPIQP